VLKSAAVVQESEILTPEECAVLLRVQPSFIYEKCRRRSRDPLPCHRIGRYLRFRRSEVLAWFDRTAVPAKKVRR
jgi:excisionase family DNA binding protein